MLKWYEYVNTSNQRPDVRDDSIRLLTDQEAKKRNAKLYLFKWVCIEQVFNR